jgi:[glutamine synthetase] adenylyltransferase / [glutamine synthetase]-adenylyl-L-tyrosine phosphorylase
MTTTSFRLPENWPPSHDPDAAQRLVERFAQVGRAEARLVTRPRVASLLHALGGNSPFLADLAVREAASLRALIASGPDQVIAAAMADLAAVAPSSRRDRIAAAMRQAKRIVALVTAIADIGGIWPLERVTMVLSDLAEATLALAMAHLRAAPARSGGSGAWRGVHGPGDGEARCP